MITQPHRRYCSRSNGAVAEQAKGLSHCVENGHRRARSVNKKRMTDSASVAAPAAFLPAPGAPAIPWDEWRENFEVYLEARGGGESWPVNRKVALLKYCLGVEGQSQYRAIQDETAQGSDEYEKALVRLKNDSASRKVWQRPGWSSPVAGNEKGNR